MRQLICGFALVVSAGCECPPTILSRAESPTHQFEAQAYMMECGAMVPFNAYARIREEGSNDWTDIVGIHDAAFDPKLHWIGPKDLHVVFECDPDGACGANDSRHWSVTGSKRWHDVRITYSIGDRLRQNMTEEQLKKLPVD